MPFQCTSRLEIATFTSEQLALRTGSELTRSGPHRLSSTVTRPVFCSAQSGSVPLGYPPYMVTRMRFVAVSVASVVAITGTNADAVKAIHQRSALIQTTAEDKTRTTNKREFRP